MGLPDTLATPATPAGSGWESNGSSTGWRPAGALTGSVGRRRRPGHADSAVPISMTPPPIQIHITSGSTITPITTGSPALAAVEAKVR